MMTHLIVLFYVPVLVDFSASIFETEGCFIPQASQTPETVRELWHDLTKQDGQAALESGPKQGEKFVMKAMAFMKSQQQ